MLTWNLIIRVVHIDNVYLKIRGPSKTVTKQIGLGLVRMRVLLESTLDAGTYHKLEDDLPGSLRKCLHEIIFFNKLSVIFKIFFKRHFLSAR